MITQHGQDGLNVSIIFTSLATFTVGMRAYTRGFMVKQIGADDITIFFALVIARCIPSRISISNCDLGIFMGTIGSLCGRLASHSQPQHAGKFTFSYVRLDIAADDAHRSHLRDGPTHSRCPA
jgi:hypothetical protein